MSVIYLRHSTTTPLDPGVRDAMLPLLEEDPRVPEALLADGRRISGLVAQSRQEIARWLGARPEEILFTSGGTESCNAAIKGAAMAAQGRSRRILAAATEHTSVLHPARSLGRLGFELVEVPVDSTGVVRLDALEELLEPGAALVSVALSSPETGTLQPLGRIAALARAAGALLHTDACLGPGLLRVDLGMLQADLASVSAHKIHGPRGVGALFVRRGVRWFPLIEGGVQEGGRRAGAEYVAGIAGFAAAARLAAARAEQDADRLTSLAGRLVTELTALDGVRLNGHPVGRLPGMVNLSVEGVDGEAMLLKLARAGIAASSGSSCVEQTGKPSYVLTAMGLPARLAQSSVLLSLGRSTRPADLEVVIGAFAESVRDLRRLASGPGGAR